MEKGHVRQTDSIVTLVPEMGSGDIGDDARPISVTEEWSTKVITLNLQDDEEAELLGRRRNSKSAKNGEMEVNLNSSKNIPNKVPRNLKAKKIIQIPEVDFEPIVTKNKDRPVVTYSSKKNDSYNNYQVNGDGLSTPKTPVRSPITNRRKKTPRSDSEDDAEAGTSDKEEVEITEGQREQKLPKRRLLSTMNWTPLNSYESKADFELGIDTFMLRVLRSVPTAAGIKRVYFCKECKKESGPFLVAQFRNGNDGCDCFVLGDSLHSHFVRPGVNYEQLMEKSKQDLNLTATMLTTMR